jgi:hypothetical protein
MILQIAIRLKNPPFCETSPFSHNTTRSDCPEES